MRRQSLKRLFLTFIRDDEEDIFLHIYTHTNFDIRTNTQNFSKFPSAVTKYFTVSEVYDE